MKKSLFVATVLSVFSEFAVATDWVVDAKLSYVNSKLKVVDQVPVFNFFIPEGKCVQGLSRTEDMIPTPIKVTQEMCVTASGGKTVFSGWVFAKERITDTAFSGDLGKSDLGALNYGQPVWFEFDGGYMHFKAGHYSITATRKQK